ncbi:molecular chaperone [Serratia sp. NPDC078593]|uniref:fimbrial biogenesis chaperone n=1 Tax=unclassified Serratia (in: enterobacteria) TaxID=2647522 RepID=UPI0037D8DC4D
MKGFIRTLCLMVTSAVMTLPAQAEGFGINATRLIYPQGAKSITATVRNTLPNLPYLVQANISKTIDGSENTPFWLTPPIFRLEPQSTNQLRIALKGESLPDDRESVFYLNTRAIPASQATGSDDLTQKVSGAVQLGVGTIIKLFYRPAGLSGSSVQAQKGLKFAVSATGLTVTNPSPYFVSLAGLNFAGKTLPLISPDALMLKPFGSHTYPTTLSRGHISWKTINDQGGIDSYEYPLP